MTSRDMNDLVRERATLQAALRKIRTASNSTVDDAEKIQKIKEALLAVEKLIAN